MTKSHRGKEVKKRNKKTGRKTVQTSVRERPVESSGDTEKPHRPGTFVKGDPRIRPGPGRPPGKFARKCRKLLAHPKTWRTVRNVVHNENNPAMPRMWNSLADRGHGKQNTNNGLSIQLPNGGEEGTGEQGQTVSAVVILMNKLDQMEKRKEKTVAHLKESA